MVEVVAMIPAKGTSNRVKNKNARDFGGSSLFERKIRQLQQSALIKKIYVGSDSSEILERAERLGALPVWRGNDVCDESIASANQMIGDFVSKVEGDVGVWVHCTNPFIYASHYDEAIKRFLSSSYPYDSLVSVTRVQSHLWNSDGFPSNFNPFAERHPFASQLNPVFFQNGGLFIQSIENFKKNSYFYGVKPLLYEMDEFESLDVNTPREFEVAECLRGYFDGTFGFAG